MNDGLSATAPDIRTVGDLAAEAAAILADTSELGLYLPRTSRQSREAVRVLGLAKRWLNEVERSIGTMSAGDALMLADCYDLVYRTVHSEPAKKDLINRIVLRAFETYIKGDTTVDQYTLYRAVRKAARGGNSAFSDRPMRWMFDTLERWHHEAAVGYDSTALTDYDIANRTAILLESDLFAFEGTRQADFKRRLAATRPASGF